MHTRKTVSIGSVAVIGLIGAACGGGSDESAPAADSAGTTTTATTTTDAADDSLPSATEAPATSSTEQPPATDPAPTRPPSTEPAATTTTEAPLPEPVTFDLATLPDLIALADQATIDPTVSPLAIVQQMVGFPFAIPVPEGSTLYTASAGFRTETFDFGYRAIAPGGAVPDIDINLDDNGPGSVEIIEIWDPVMAQLGFERNNSTASDPGDPGGPNSVNHVYTAAEPATVINGVAGELSPVFVWSDEDLTGGSYSDDREILAGYRIDFDFDVVSGQGIPIPIVNALLEQLPLPDGLALREISVDLNQRAPDAYLADRGLNYISMRITWEAPADLLDDVITFYTEPATLFADESTLMAGEEDWTDEGTIERTGLADYGTGSKRLALLLVQRYEATLGIDASSDDVQPMSLTFSVDINPIAPELALPTE